MVEKVATAGVRAVTGVEETDRSAIGLTALQETTARCRRVCEAELHRLRLKADIPKLAWIAPTRRWSSS